MRIYGTWANIDLERFCLEIENSTENQALAYSNPQLNIDSPPIDWEQGLQEGHSLHPLHKSRYPIISDFRTAKLYFVAIESSVVQVEGDYEHWIQQLLPGTTMNQRDVVFPVHELQLISVERVPKRSCLVEDCECRRSLCEPSLFLPTSDFCVKLPVDFKTQQIVRTMEPWDIMMGQSLSPILPLIESAAKEYGGSLMMTQYRAAGHYRIIVCATLTENVDAIWGDKPDKIAILREYSDQFLRAVLPPVFSHGLGLSAHLQNSLVRLDPKTKTIKGFVVRDLGFLKVHRPTFTRSTSLDINVPKKSMYAEKLEDVYWYLLSPVINGHLSYFVRELHPGLAGWKIVREVLERLIPQNNTAARHVLLESPESLSKSNITMEIHGFDKLYPHIAVPNPLYHCKFAG
ncbi:hypothetical protein EYZ11_001996 [Aspergillus tanneri]|uniref:Aerobactin siderophore biosynthesis IucA/IucC-like C-terminal domain-containing protein n=1 Tax=Aspergillus tanneri TaxID=1220188 RepID=A0A4S3JTF9_9EURO|nr:hypothetical protein EYZ11_001996 [Aspergillus tanneri]